MSFRRLLLAAAAMFVTGTAEAQTPPACKGKDLIAALEASDAAGYAKLVEAARKIPNAEGLLYRIDKPGREPSWLFGTMHVTDERLAELPAEAKAAIEGSRVVALELDEIALDQAGMAEKMGRLLAERGLDPARRGLDGFSPADRRFLEQALADRGFKDVPPERLRPWVLLTFVSMPACEMARSAAGLKVVDTRVANAGVAAGAEIVGLEEIEEQIDAMASISPRTAARLVAGMAKLGPGLDDVFETMVGLYQRRQIGYLFGDLKLAGVGDSDVESFTEFLEILVDKRNLTMRDRALPLIEQGRAFIAVGALHLVGEKGLVELFRKEGFTVTRVF
jgi:uncharacterized protein